jgi:hypothetical protein
MTDSYWRFRHLPLGTKTMEGRDHDCVDMPGRDTGWLFSSLYSFALVGDAPEDGGITEGWITFETDVAWVLRVIC